MMGSIDYSVTMLDSVDVSDLDIDGQFFAAFRDQSAVDAFERAHPKLQACLLEAGIAPVAASTDAPLGFYNDRDSAMQAHLRSCVMDALESEMDPAVLEDAAFDIHAFLESLGVAMPYGQMVMVDPERQQTYAVSTPKSDRLEIFDKYIHPVMAGVGVMVGIGIWASGLLFGI